MTKVIEVEGRYCVVCKKTLEVLFQSNDVKEQVLYAIKKLYEQVPVVCMDAKTNESFELNLLQ